jgi:hypothetical protein
MSKNNQYCPADAGAGKLQWAVRANIDAKISARNRQGMQRFLHAEDRGTG